MTEIAEGRAVRAEPWPILETLTAQFPGRSVSVSTCGDRLKVEIAMPAPLPTYVVTVIPGTWTAEQLAEGAKRWEAEASHGLAMAGVP